MPIGQTLWPIGRSTGADFNFRPLRLLNQIADKKTKIKTTKIKLNVHTGENIPVKGASKVQYSFKYINLSTDFYIVESNSKLVISL